MNEEYLSMLGFNKQKKKPNPASLARIYEQEVYTFNESLSLPDTVDWVKAGWVTPVQRQVCGFIY